MSRNSISFMSGRGLLVLTQIIAFLLLSQTYTVLAASNYDGAPAGGLRARQAVDSTTGELVTTGESDDEGTTGEHLSAFTTGDAQASTGEQGSAISTGDAGASSTTGEASGAASTTGEAPAAGSTTGEAGAAGSTTGEAGAGFTTTGDQSSASGSGPTVGAAPNPVTGSPDSTFILVFWTPSVKRQASKSIVLEASSDSATFNQIYIGDATAFTFNHTGLTPVTTYFYRVFFTSGDGNSPYSDVTPLTTLGLAGNSTNSTGGANVVDPGQSLATGDRASGLSGGVIAGIVIAVIAVLAAIAAVIAKTAFNAPAAASGHWLDSAVQNPLYQAGEQAFENPLYDPPAEVAAAQPAV